jgi:hypothetical protein
MASLSVKLSLLPGITRDINITLDDLLQAFNGTWSLEDRLELSLRLNLGNTEDSTRIVDVAKIFNNLNINDLTVGQLLILDSATKDFQNKINAKKNELKEQLNG